MRALIQRVSRAQATTHKTEPIKTTRAIGQGLVILVGFESDDTPVSIDRLAEKIKNLRIFSDNEGKMNLAGPQVNAEYLVVSQFTLYADCRYGNRPSFQKAAPKNHAIASFEHFLSTIKRLVGDSQLKHTPFGSMLDVELVNEGPVTIWLDGAELA